jgi:alanine racemase
MAVGKADAYGHGAAAVSARLSLLGVDYFAVATAGEAIELRDSGISEPELILGTTLPEHAEALINDSLTQTVTDLDYAKAISRAASARNAKIRVHIKVDTGMSRFGLAASDDPARAAAEAAEICSLDGLAVEGIFTHFATSELENDGYTGRQLDLFCSVYEKIKERGFEIPLRHTANSGAVLNYPEAHFDMVRLGILLYGLYPSAEARNKIDLRPAMQLKSIVAQVKRFETPVYVSYGRTYQTEGPATLAVIPAGYADGIFRTLSGKMEILAHGRRAPQIGRVCMDLSVCDVSGIPELKMGDTVTLFGRDGKEEIRVEEIAERAGTIPYEIVCSISKRVPRLYR